MTYSPPGENKTDEPIPVLDYAPPPAEYSVGSLKYSRASLLKLCAWILFADIGLAFRSRALGPMMQLLLKGMGASNFLIAFGTGTVAQTLSLILGPVVASFSDRTRTRWGRRLPYIFITVPILTVSMAGMGFSPILGRYLHRLLGDSSPGEKPCGLIAFLTIFIIYDLAAIVQGKTWGGLINDVVPHKVLGRFSAASRMVSLGAGVLFAQFGLAQVERYQLAAFLILSAVYGSSMVVLALFVREGAYAPPEPRPPSRGILHAWYAAIAFIKDCYGVPYYRWVMVMLCIDDLAFNSVNLFSLLHAKSLNMSMWWYGTCLSATWFFGLIMAYPIGMLADRFHPFRVSAVFLFLYGVCAVWSGFFIHDTLTFVIGFMLHGVFATSYNTAAASMGYRMLARSRFMILAAGQGIVGTVITMVISPLLGLFLDWSGDQYRYTYLVGAGYVALGVPLYIIVYRKFKALGGPNHYVAPGDEDTPKVQGG